MDFELATWKAVTKVLPDVRIRGCLFHLTQAVWRKCVELGLKPAYMTDDKTHKFVRKLMALPFVPANHIPELFRKTSERVQAPGQLRDLLDYFQRQWVEHPTFKPKTWSSFNVAVRTNNHVEGWHRRLNDKCHERTLGLYRLVQQPSLLPIQIRLIQEGKLRAFVRRNAVACQEEVFQAWMQFKDEDINVSQLLSRCASIHGPIVD